MNSIRHVDPQRTPSPPPPLSTEHRRTLEEGSAISPAIVAGRGYWTATKRAQLEGLFPDWQRRAPALVVPMFSPDGVTSRAQIRPERPRQSRRTGKALKYETAYQDRPIVDVHPFMREAVKDASVPVLITEGVKKADAATSRGLCAVALAGVDGWVSKGGVPLSCWEHVALEERQVFVAYDSDVMTKPEVQGALGRLVAFLEGRGAEVRVIYLPAAAGGSKQGVDDYLAGGATVAELMLLARPFVREELATVRLSREEKLGTAVAELWSDWQEMPVRTRKQNTAQSVTRVVLEEAGRSGELLKTGRVRVQLDRRTIAEGAQTSVGSVHKAIEYLEGEGRLKRDNEGRRAEAAGAFILIPQKPSDSAKSDQNGEREATEGEGQEGESNKESVRENASFARTSDRGDYFLRYAPPDVPELRWPKLLLYWAREKGRRKVVDWHYVRRLGKKRGAIIGHVLEAGGSATVEELMDRFASPRTRPWDFRRRTLGPIVEAGIFAPVEEGATLTESWREALEEKRQADDEIADAERQRKRHADQRRKYRRRHEHPADEDQGELLGPERTAEILEQRRKDEERRWIEQQRQKVGMTAAVFVADELEGIAGVRWRELRQRWIEKGGNAEDLRRAVTFGPFRFEREPSDEHLYVYPGSTAGDRSNPASVAPLHRAEPQPDTTPDTTSAVRSARAKPHKRADGVYVHPGDCACEWCGEDLEASYARTRGVS
jgi:hypothetical protein